MFKVFVPDEEEKKQKEKLQEPRRQKRKYSCRIKEWPPLMQDGKLEI